MNDKLSSNCSIEKIVSKYRYRFGVDGKPMPYRQFSGLLSKPLKDIGMNISPKTIHNWETGNHTPSMPTLQLLRNMAPNNSWQQQFVDEIMGVILAPINQTG
jgi:hypothetical protein